MHLQHREKEAARVKDVLEAALRKLTIVPALRDRLTIARGRP